MKSSYYLQNNPMVVMGVVCTVIKIKKKADIGRIAVMLPMLLDNKIVDALLDRRLQYSMRQLIQQNGINLANYNDRYISLLTPLYHALSIMLDADMIKLNGSMIEPSFNAGKCSVYAFDSCRIKRIVQATQELIELSEKESNKELYKLLKVAL